MKALCENEYLKSLNYTKGITSGQLRSDPDSNEMKMLMH
jgi:hypothetical protein